MNREHKDLYGRIRKFRFDPDGASATFAGRLAAENGWSARFAERVIDEYRKFAFLAVAAGHPVSPPDAVDQAWHLHLVYTRSYWDVSAARCSARHCTTTPAGAAGRRS